MGGFHCVGYGGNDGGEEMEDSPYIPHNSSLSTGQSFVIPI